MRWQDLIATARLLTIASHPNAQPLPDSLRRAVSAAYYAMFHALANSNADCLAGMPHDPLTEHAWSRSYRGLNRNSARRNLLQDRNLFSPQVRQFADSFAQLQDQRHRADYNPNRTFSLAQALYWIGRAESLSMISCKPTSTSARWTPSSPSSADVRTDRTVLLFPCQRISPKSRAKYI